ncbi:exopolysaccharide production protein YjbE [Methylobacterium sp. NEAU 140]|uniref:exopolysaccharide production protein YjbE n=1 Tax=Methylobacterium sp. NEAU 140 TaxID=3064945 RepID=UPI0027329764|nr:exopolysaccharide production protein YjbE [Methylobacterium sp. NEAU 140]MDP4023496.1 exopolysaccharide production protein YjbE [Methylobacterium sp. NEAU 140]
MTRARVGAAAALLLLTAGTAFAAPCNTGATKPKAPDQQAANPKSSDVDASSKNLAGGQQPASPGTVGAMNNVGAAQTAARQAPTEAGSRANETDPAAKNLAGGQQPASPGTVGAMNNAAAARQTTGSTGDGC